MRRIGPELSQQGNRQECTAVQQQAAQLAQLFEGYAKLSGGLALSSGLAAAVAGVGEPFSLGGDTPATIALASSTAFFAEQSFVTGAAAATLNAFASGNTNALASFDESHVAGIAASTIASKIPGISTFAETIGRLAEKAAELQRAAEEACP